MLEFVILATLTVAVATLGGAFWFLWIFAAADFALLLFSLFRKLRRKSCKKAETEKILHIDDTFEMTGSQFEDYIAGLYQRLGYKIITVKKSRDQGIDIIARRFFKIGLQVKCYDRPVGVRAVQEAAAGKKFYGLKKAAVVTNSIFTDSAKSLAAKNRIQLIDRKLLAKMAQKAGGRFGRQNH